MSFHQLPTARRCVYALLPATLLFLWVLKPLAFFSVAKSLRAVVTEHLEQSKGQYAAPSMAGGKTQARILKSYGQLPLYLDKNQGQADPDVKFLSRGEGYSLFLTSNEAVLALPYGGPERTQRYPTVKAPAHNARTRVALLRFKLGGANPTPEISGREGLPGRSNYFIGDNPKNWRTNIPSFAKAKYKGVYPGVDLVYYGSRRQLEYDFIVAPGANPGAITLDIQGTRNMEVDGSGDLVLDTHAGQVRLHKPVAYQEAGKQVDLDSFSSGPPWFWRSPNTNSGRRYVECSYVVRAGSRVAFHVEAYDRRKTLVIDPVLAYSTFLGGTFFDAANAVAVDSTGNAYITGTTMSIDFPVTTGSLQTTFGGTDDAFVSKLSPDGSSLVYSTYLGGAGDDQGSGIAVDKNGYTYVIGKTASVDFPTTGGAVLGSFRGGLSDGFVTKLSPDGSSLAYSTYLGGTDSDEAHSVAVDSGGNAYVTGFTQSADLLTTSGTAQPTFNGSFDAFIAKLNPTGSAFVYLTYLGGSGDDRGTGIAVDSIGNAYVTGSTFSTDFPTTPGAFETLLPGIGSKAFVTELDAAGSNLVYSTFLGGSASDNAAGIALDTSGNAYVTGSTTSTDFPATSGGFRTTCGSDGTCNGGFSDAFVTKLNPTGSALAYSTYLGGNNVDSGTGISVDTGGNAFVSGYTISSDFPTTSDALRSALGGDYDGFVVEVDPTGSTLAFSTFLGGTGFDLALGIAVDAQGGAYAVGETVSADFPATAGAVQPSFGTGFLKAFITKITTVAPNTPPVANAGPDQTIECAGPFGALVTLDGSGSRDPDGDPMTFKWTDSAGVVVSTSAKVTITLPVGGPYTYTLTVSDGRGGTASAQTHVTVRDSVAPTIAVALSPNVLWPPNHRMVEITATISTNDTCDLNPAVRLVSISSNEPLTDLGQDNPASDVQGAAFGTDDRSFFLRAERTTQGTGRVYNVTYSATDASGNSGSRTAAVIVPANNSSNFTTVAARSAHGHAQASAHTRRAH